MIKFFRTIRHDYMKENKTGKYLKYAIGEIILVVIGILLALQINNWNSEYKADKNLKEIYKQIQTDLKVDTTRIERAIVKYDEKDKIIQDILDKKIKLSFYDTINSMNYKDCSICRPETTYSYNFKPITKGYNLLKETNSLTEIEKDSLADYINDFYSQIIPRIDNQYQDIQNIIFENIKKYQKHSWFSDWYERKYNRELLIFLFESEIYRKELSRFNIYTKHIFIGTLKNYRIRATEILKLLEQEIEK